MPVIITILFGAETENGVEPITAIGGMVSSVFWFQPDTEFSTEGVTANEAAESAA